MSLDVAEGSDGEGDVFVFFSVVRERLDDEPGSELSADGMSFLGNNAVPLVTG